MRFLQFLTLSGLMVAGNVALAASIDNASVPNRCWEVCGQVVGISHKCDNLQRHKNVDEATCMCNWERASIMIPQCEACIAYYNDDRGDTHNNAVYDILTSCSMSTTTWKWAPAATTLSSATRATDTVMTTTAETTTAVPTTAETTTASATQNSASSSTTDSETPTATEDSQSSSSVNVNSETPSSAATNTNTNTASNAQQTDNAAPGSAIPRAASLAAAVGLISFVWL